MVEIIDQHLFYQGWRRMFRFADRQRDMRLRRWCDTGFQRGELFKRIGLELIQIAIHGLQ
jgi:hypothetical protein